MSYRPRTLGVGISRRSWLTDAQSPPRPPIRVAERPSSTDHPLTPSVRGSSSSVDLGAPSARGSSDRDDDWGSSRHPRLLDDHPTIVRPIVARDCDHQPMGFQIIGTEHLTTGFPPTRQPDQTGTVNPLRDQPADHDPLPDTQPADHDPSTSAAPTIHHQGAVPNDRQGRS